MGTKAGGRSPVSNIKRREFITLLGGAVGWPLTARAQQVPKLPTIGFLGAATASFERASTDAFVQRLRELAWIENRTVAIEYRWAEGRDERFAQIAAEFVRLKVGPLSSRRRICRQDSARDEA
jgi:putative tryptophan/tyrosine transport system substrate-binding protein